MSEGLEQIRKCMVKRLVNDEKLNLMGLTEVNHQEVTQRKFSVGCNYEGGFILAEGHWKDTEEAQIMQEQWWVV